MKIWVLILTLVLPGLLRAEDTMKGADLYSFRDVSGRIVYAILPGTNRVKAAEEVVQAKVELQELEAKLRALPPKTQVVWNNKVAVADPEGLQLELPSRTEVAKVKRMAAHARVNLKVVKD